MNDIVLVAVIGGIFTAIAGSAAAIPGIMALRKGDRKRKIEEAELISTVSLNLIKPLEARIASLEAEKVNWQLERAVLVNQVTERDGIIVDLRFIVGKLVGGVTILTDQLNKNGLEPGFQLSEEMLDHLRKHISK